MERLAQLGAEVLVCRADAASAEDMASAIARAEERFGTINGIIHTAGVPGGSVLQRLTPAQAAPVFSPKLAAALVLDRLIPEDRSSISSSSRRLSSATCRWPDAGTTSPRTRASIASAVPGGRDGAL